MAENCKSPQTVFDTFGEWNDHFQEEIIASDTDILKCCPLCSYECGVNGESSSAADRETLKLHIAIHLQTIALLSLYLGPLTQSIHDRIEPRKIVQSQLALPLHASGLRSNQQMAPQVFNAFTKRTMSTPKIVIKQIPQMILSTIQPSGTSFQEQIMPPIAKNGIPTPPISRNHTPNRLPSCSPFPPCPPSIPLENIMGKSSETYEVLVVDDNIVSRKIITRLLKKRGHMAISAVNGQEAIDAVRKRKYDVILIDLWMPVMVRLISRLLPVPYHSLQLGKLHTNEDKGRT